MMPHALPVRETHLDSICDKLRLVFSAAYLVYFATHETFFKQLVYFGSNVILQYSMLYIYK